MTLRTDLAIAQLPSSPPFSGLLGLNATATDPIFGTTLMRLTDGSSGAGNFLSMQTNEDPASRPMWNTDDTLLVVRDTGSNNWLYQFNPTTLQGTQLGTAAPYKFNGPYCWSRVSNNILYSITGTVLSAITFSLVDGVWTYQGISEICDFADILPDGFVVNWHADLTISEGDAIFSMAFSEGNQDTGYYACLYNPGRGFRMIDTQSLLVTGSWGAIGTATLENTGLANFFLHNMGQTPNAAYTTLSPVGQASGFIWGNESLVLTQTGLSGHHGLGELGIYTGGPGGGQYDQALYTTPTVHTPLLPKQAGPPGLPSYQTPPQHYIGDQHSGFSPIDPNDRSLLWVTNGAPSVFPFASCWEGEVRGYDVTGAISGAQGTVYRACHTYNSGKSTQYIVQNAMLGVSRSGRFLAFTSDMGGAGTVGPLGSVSGGATGVVGAKDGTLARGDVFICAVTLSVAPPTLSITTSVLAQGVVGVAFSQTLQAIGGTSPYSWSVTSGALPAGLALNASTGVISGTPTASGTFNFSITVTDSATPTPNTAIVALSVTVNPALSIATTALVAGQVSVGYNQTLQPAGGVSPYAWALTSGTLPTGLTLNSSTGVIAGTPSLIGTFSFTVSLTDSEATPVTVSANLGITVGAGPAFVPSGEMYDITDIDNPGMANHHLEVWCQVIVD